MDTPKVAKTPVLWQDQVERSSWDLMQLKP